MHILHLFPLIILLYNNSINICCSTYGKFVAQKLLECNSDFNKHKLFLSLIDNFDLLIEYNESCYLFYNILLYCNNEDKNTLIILLCNSNVISKILLYDNAYDLFSQLYIIPCIKDRLLIEVNYKHNLLIKTKYGNKIIQMLLQD